MIARASNPVCLKCGRLVPLGAGFCPNCGTQLGEPSFSSSHPSDPETALTGAGTTNPGTGPTDANRLGTTSASDAPTINPTNLATSMDSPSPRPPVRADDGPFQAGQQVGPRYTIIRLLGTGGMGAVYQAFDHELGVAVAIKVIRPAAQSDARAAKELEQRFKRELVLARQVTHKYVVRIHDLGDIDGIKYLTMPFVEGETLAALLQRVRKIPVPRALAAARQIALGLAAAHDKGVVHRDLKPENIMIEKAEGGGDGDALIMDFGIARSVEHGGTQTAAGSVIGTLEYMAPEQAQGKQVDHRADIYAFGLMLYDMLVGRQRLAGSDNAMSELLARMSHSPPAPGTIDGQIPEAFDRIVQRCLQPSPDARFATTTELVEALEALAPDGHERAAAPGTAPVAAVPAHAAARPKWQLAVAALMVVIGGVGGWLLSNRGGPPAAPVARDPISVLVAQFENKTGDPVFDGVLEQALGLGIEGASFITAYPQRDALRSAAAIKPGSSLDEQTARLVAVRDGVKLVLAGTVSTAASGYSMSVRAIDAADGKDVASAERTATDKGAVLAAVGQMATSLRRDLGDTADTSVDAGRETFTAASLEAARAYVLAQELAAGGKFAEAIAQYQEAVQRDPNFGRAYAGWATAVFRAGRPDEADQLWRKSLALMERMTEREKFRTLGGYYLGPGGNDAQAAENYRTLVEKYPSDGPGLNNLAVAYFRLLDFARASQQGQKATEVYPKSLNYRTNLALYAMYASDFATASAEARTAIALSPFDKAYLPIAMGALVAGKPEEATAAYAEMAKASTRGASIASMGRADLAMYQGRFADARTELLAGAASDEAGNLRAPRALKLAALAEIAAATGGPDVAKLADEALTLAKSDAVVIPAARLLVSAGRIDAARALAADLEKQLPKRSRALAGVIRAEIALAAKKHVEAIDALTAARGLADLWLVRYMLGRVYVEAGKYAEAIAELEACQKRIGEASDVFLDDWPTFRYTVPLKYWLARAQDGLGLADSAARGYQAYLELRGSVAGDPLAADARKRMASR
jgi:Flp pilus assembly protein TadD/tRNA A-37 threonylcarbamoyl transferase component Bud32